MNHSLLYFPMGDWLRKFYCIIETIALTGSIYQRYCVVTYIFFGQAKVNDKNVLLCPILTATNQKVFRFNISIYHVL